MKTSSGQSTFFACYRTRITLESDPIAGSNLEIPHSRINSLRCHRLRYSGALIQYHRTGALDTAWVI